MGKINTQKRKERDKKWKKVQKKKYFTKNKTDGTQQTQEKKKQYSIFQKTI